MDAFGPKLQTIRAETLEDVFLTMQLEPLVSSEEIQAFYRSELNETRGGDKMERLRRRLVRSYEIGVPLKACLMGHPGVGKSTELSRLITESKPNFCTIRFSAPSVLDPGNFKPLDVLLVMMMEVAKQTEQAVGTVPSDARLQEILEWFASEKITRTQKSDSTATIEAGLGGKQDSLWEKVLGLFAHLKGEIKFAAARSKETTDYRLSRLDDLIEIANRLLDECNRLLKQETGQEWLFIGEDFDKSGIAPERVKDLFINYGNIFHELRTHLIFSVPISLYYSADAPRLPFGDAFSFVIPDTPVYHQNHGNNDAGRAAVRAVLAARMNLDLFEEDQALRLIVASGGNLRELFDLVTYAVESAQLRDAETINAEDVKDSILNKRSDYERRLGQSPFDIGPVPYSDKVVLLKRIYMGEADAQITNSALYSLLSSRAVQEFNGQRWFGVHPLVVDILKKQGHLTAESGEVLGGTI
jgi:hypothetical protein